jgi:hypothetical protein
MKISSPVKAVFVNYYFGIKKIPFSLLFHKGKLAIFKFRHDYYVTTHKLHIIFLLIAKAKRKKGVPHLPIGPKEGAAILAS